MHMWSASQLSRWRSVHFGFLCLYVVAALFAVYQFEETTLGWFTEKQKSLFSLNDVTIYHGYCVQRNLIIPQIEQYDRITQILHLSSDYLDEKLIEQVENWNAPVSLTIVLVDADELDCVLWKLQTYLEASLSIRQHLRVHLIYSFNLKNTCFTRISTNMSTRKPCKENNEKTVEKIANYPINVARNVARKYSSSKYILIADYEHLFSMDFEEEMRRIVENNLNGTVEEKKIFVYRIFEVDDDVQQMPRTREELFELFKQGKAIVFHDRFYPGGHSIEGLDRWFQLKTPEDGIEVHDFKYTRFNWEPQFVSRSDIPMHDEKFPFLVRDNTALRWELCRAGYEMDIVADHFMYHKGIKTKKNKMSQKVQRMNKKRFQLALDYFNDRMDNLYPSTKDSCPTFSA